MGFYGRILDEPPMIAVAPRRKHRDAKAEREKAIRKAPKIA